MCILHRISLCMWKKKHSSSALHGITAPGDTYGSPKNQGKLTKCSMKRWRLDTANWSNHKGLGRFGCHLLKQIPCARMFRYRSQEESLDELTEVYHWVRLVLYRSSFDLEIWVKLLSMYIRFSSGVPTDPRLLVNIRTIVNVKSNRYNSHFYSPVKIYRNMIMTLRTHMLALITGTVSEIFNSSQQHWLLRASKYNFICTLVILCWECSPQHSVRSDSENKTVQ